MTGYQGFFLQGMASGIQSGFEMGWKKKQQKKLEDAKKKLEDESFLINNMIAEAGKDGYWSDDEVTQINTAVLAGGYEIQERYKSAREAISSMNKNQFEQELQWFDSITGALSDGLIDPKNASEIFEFGRSNFATSKKGKDLYNAYENMYKKKYEAAQQPQTVSPYDFYGQSDSATKAAIAPSVAGQTKGLENIQFNQPTTQPQTELDKITETQKKLEAAYKTGNAPYFNQMAKSLNSPATFETWGQGYEKPGAGITTEKTRVTNVNDYQEYKTKALSANTLDDMHAVKEEYKGFGYKDLDVEDADWIDYKKKNASKILEYINNIFPDGKLDKDTEYTFPQNGKPVTKTGGEWYKELYKDYMALLALMKKNGIDTSSYPNILPFEEMTKTKFQKFWQNIKERGKYQQ